MDPEIGWPVSFPWKRRRRYVEWDLTGSPGGALGAVVYPSVAPMVVVKELEPVYQTYEDVAAAVAEWVRSHSSEYRINEEYERFKALAHQMEGDAPPEQGLGYGRPSPG